MITQEKNYIQTRKKEFLVKSLIWAMIIIGLVMIGIVLTGNNGNIFTVLAAVSTLGFAQNLTRYISFRRFKDPEEKDASILEEMKGSLYIFHGTIIPDTTTTVYFEHIVVTAKSIYFISKDNTTIQKNKSWLALRLEKKGLQQTQLHFVTVADSKALKNASLKIQKDACYTNEELDKNKRIIEGILM